MDTKGYFVDYGYMGWVGDRYVLFTSEKEYWEWVEGVVNNFKRGVIYGKGMIFFGGLQAKLSQIKESIGS